jgi:hypothetical protein
MSCHVVRAPNDEALAALARNLSCCCPLCHQTTSWRPPDTGTNPSDARALVHLSLRRRQSGGRTCRHNMLATSRVAAFGARRAARVWPITPLAAPTQPSAYRGVCFIGPWVATLTPLQHGFCMLLCTPALPPAPSAYNNNPQQPVALARDVDRCPKLTVALRCTLGVRIIGAFALDHPKAGYCSLTAPPATPVQVEHACVS